MNHLKKMYMTNIKVFFQNIKGFFSIKCVFGVKAWR